VEDGNLVEAVHAGGSPDGELPAAAAFVEDEPAPPRSLAMSDRRARAAEMVGVHGDAVMGLCLRMLRDRTRAEDVTQRVFLEAYRDLERCDGPASVRAWLLGIANHRCLDALKTQKTSVARIEEYEQALRSFANPGAGPFEHASNMQLAAALEECLGQLSAETRGTVLLRFQTGATYEELAAQLGVAADTLQVRVARALPVLRKCLEKKGWTGE
jgi:RNA polymerase sigma-70 factor (ECF subfamily)